MHVWCKDKGEIFLLIAVIQLVHYTLHTLIWGQEFLSLDPAFLTNLYILYTPTLLSNSTIHDSTLKGTVSVSSTEASVNLTGKLKSIWCEQGSSWYSKHYFNPGKINVQTPVWKRTFLSLSLTLMLTSELHHMHLHFNRMLVQQMENQWHSFIKRFIYSTCKFYNYAAKPHVYCMF